MRTDALMNLMPYVGMRTACVVEQLAVLRQYLCDQLQLRPAVYVVTVGGHLQIRFW